MENQEKKSLRGGKREGWPQEDHHQVLWLPSTGGSRKNPRERAREDRVHYSGDFGKV